MDLLLGVLKIIHFFENTLYYILVVSYNVGRLVFFALVYLYGIIVNLLSFAAIVGDEFFCFVCELCGSIYDIAYNMTNSTNSAFDCVIEGYNIFLRKVAQFFINTQCRGRLLTDSIGQGATNLIMLVRDAVVLIADACWWIILLIPRFLISLTFAIGDCIIYFLNGIVALLGFAIKAIITDVLRLTIAVFVLLFVLKMRRYLMLIFKHAFIKLAKIIFPKPSIRKQTTSTDYNLPSVHCCVICRERAKTIVVLPCKHLCLCRECSVEVNVNIFICPLCRGNIASLLNVYY